MYRKWKHAPQKATRLQSTILKGPLYESQRLKKPAGKAGSSLLRFVDNPPEGGGGGKLARSTPFAFACEYLQRHGIHMHSGLNTLVDAFFWQQCKSF